MTPLIHRAVEAALEGEIEAHLSSTDSKDNRRNGHNRKHVKSGHGTFELKSPRDRSGTFEPEIIKKRQTVLTETLDQQLLALYGLGSSYADIKQHMQEMYGVEVSSATINSVTNKLIPTITEWRLRPLEAVYPIVFMDGIYFKVREEGRVVSKVMYSLLGIDQSGKKDILGLYMADSEGANFWASVLADLKARGVEDIMIACVDGLKGFPEAIESIFPKTTVQLCNASLNLH